MSRALLNSYGMHFFDEDDDLLLGFVSEAAQKGRVVNGYQAKYVNRYYGTRLQNGELSDHLQIICNISANEEGTQELKSFDVHNIGSSVWKLSILNECTDEEKTYPGERKLIINKANGKEGLLVVNVMNADILPSYLPGEEVELQMIGVAVDVDYYKSREEGNNNTPGEYKLANGFMCGTQFLYNHQVLPEGTVRDIDYSTNDWIAVRGTVKQAYLHKIMIDEENELTRYVETIIETDFGDLKISHSIDQIKEEQRDNIKPGSDFIGVIVLQGDALINKYENGIVFDYENNLKAFCFALENGNIDRLDMILTDDAVFASFSTNRRISGKENVKEYLKKMYEVQKNSGQHIERKIEPVGFADETKKCISVLFEKSENDQYMFLDLSDDGRIKTIVAFDRNNEPVFH